MDTKIKLKRWIFALAALGWMFVIFSFSAQQAEQSTELSDDVITVVCTFFVSGFKGLTEVVRLQYIDGLTFIVRKTAHATVYAVLAFLASGFLSTFKLKGKKAFFIAVGFCLIYAASDELHQYFVPGRSCELRDVCIDTCGAALGAGVYRLGSYLMKKGKRA